MSGEVAVCVVSKAQDTLHGGWRVLWRGLTAEQARALCSDPRTAGAQHMLVWTYLERTHKWIWQHDNGSYDHVLREHGVEPVRRKKAA